MFELRSEHLSRTAILASLYHGLELEKLTFVQPAATGKMGSTVDFAASDTNGCNVRPNGWDYRWWRGQVPDTRRFSPTSHHGSQ